MQLDFARGEIDPLPHTSTICHSTGALFWLYITRHCKRTFMSTTDDTQEASLPPSDYAVHLLQSLFKSESYSDVTIRILPEDDATGEGRR